MMSLSRMSMYTFAKLWWDNIEFLHNSSNLFLFSSTETTLLSNNTIRARFQKHVRHFRRGKTSDETKINPESLATPFTNVVVDSNNLRVGRLFKPFLFTVAVSPNYLPPTIFMLLIYTFQFSAASFAGATLWEYENMRAHALVMLKKPIKFFKRKAEQSVYATVCNFYSFSYLKGYIQCHFRNVIDRLWENYKNE